MYRPREGVSLLFLWKIRNILTLFFIIRFTNNEFKLYCKNNGIKLIHPYTHEKVNQIFKKPQFCCYDTKPIFTGCFY